MSTASELRLVGEREPTEVVARYLEAIYYMRTEGEPVRSARLADWLGVSRPTVTVALRRMTRDGMVRLDGRKEIDLTRRGPRAGAAIVPPPRGPECRRSVSLGPGLGAGDAGGGPRGAPRSPAR